MKRFTICLLVAAASAAFVACDPSPGEVREWRAEDHEQPDAGQGRQGAQNKQVGQGDDQIDLVELAWQKNCSSCHGQRGAGDGPQGQMVKATDLTDPGWQSKRSDADIAGVIKTGRGKMPKFDLPPAVLDGIVKRIRKQKAGG